MRAIYGRSILLTPWPGVLGAVMMIISTLAAPPVARAETANPLAWRIERPFALNRDIPLEIPDHSTRTVPETSCSLTLAWVRFDERAGDLFAKLRVAEHTTMKANWEITIACLDSCGDRVAGVSTVMQSRLMYRGVSHTDEGDLSLDLGSYKLAPRIQRIAVSLARVLDSTPVIAEFESMDRWVRPKGDCRLRVRLHRPWRSIFDPYAVLLWRAYDEDDPDLPRSAIFSNEGFHLRDPANHKIWIPWNNRHLHGKPGVRFTGLPPGEYRVDASPDAYQRYTPIAWSDPVTLDGKVKEAKVSVTLSGECSLRVVVVDAMDGTPLPTIRVRIKSAEGRPFGGFRTDASGQMKLDRLAPGEYEVHVGENGWSLGFYHPELADQFRKRFSVRAGQENICVIPWRTKHPD